MNSVFRLRSLICQSAPGSCVQGEEEAGVLAYIGEIMMFLLIPSQEKVQACPAAEASREWHSLFLQLVFLSVGGCFLATAKQDVLGASLQSPGPFPDSQGLRVWIHQVPAASKED